MHPITIASHIGHEDFLADAHAIKYRDELARHPEAFARIFALLNDPANEQRLIDAEMHGLPAMCGVVRFIETDPVIEPILAGGRAGHRFRQTVGVALKLKMAKLGWRTTGRKGTVKGAEHFSKAEHYAADTWDEPGSASKALSALAAVAAIGDDDERRVTGSELMDALATARHAEGRSF